MPSRGTSPRWTRDGLTFNGLVAEARPASWSRISRVAGHGWRRNYCAEGAVRTAGRMSSRETGRRDPARVPPAVLRHRILARSRLPVLVVTLAIVYGTVGYWLVEGKNLLDAFYETMLTLSTLGVGPGPPPGPGGKIFTVSLILFGVVALFTAIGVGTEVVVSGEFGRWLRMNQVSRSIGRLSGHYVICAYGRVGRAVMEEVRRRGYTAVVIESKPELEPLLAEHGVRYIPGDPADETVLRQAGIERARGLICAVDSDAANVFITLTARALNPGPADRRARLRQSLDRQAGARRRRRGCLAVRAHRAAHGRPGGPAVRAGSPRPAQPRLGHPARGGRRPGRNAPGQPDDHRGPAHATPGWPSSR